VEDDQMTRVIETDARDEEEERWIDDESGGDGWDDDGDDAIPPRPRGRLLRPVPLALVAVTIAAAGFLGGVLAQKGSEGGGATAGPGGGSLPSFAAAKAEAGGSESTGGATTGTVTSVEGHTIYVKEADGTVVAVKVDDGATVTRDSNVTAKKVHPGDTVVVQGAEHGSTVKASSIAATESGIESSAAPGGTSVESLFEE
jgi:hypothetical protein